MRPGSWRMNSSRVAMYPAYGPPKRSGIPSDWASPTATSAPRLPGASSTASEIGSHTATHNAPTPCAASAREPHDRPPRHVGPEVARGFEYGERDRVAHRDAQRADAVRRLGRRPYVLHDPEEV